MKSKRAIILFQVFNMLVCTSVDAQILFNKRYGSSYSDAGKAITQTEDMGFAVAGISFSNGAGGDIFLLKLDQQGSIQWQKNIFGVNAEDVHGVYQLDNGNYVIGGQTYSYGSGCTDAFVIEVDSRGELLWAKAYGDVQCNNIECFSLSYNGGYIASGTSNGSGQDGWLLKTDQNGILEWSRSYLGTNSFFSVKPSIDGGYVAVGSGSEISILKTNAFGDPLWFKRYLSSTGNTYCYDVETHEDGSSVLTGQVYFNAFGNVADIFLMKIDQSGNLIWFKTYGFTFFDYGLSIKKTYNGYILSGWTNSFGHGDDDAFLLKTDENGNLLWAKTYGDVWYDRAFQVQTLSDSGYVFVGQSNSAGNIDSSFVYVVRTDQNGNSCDYLDWTPLQRTQIYSPSSKVISAVSFGVDSICTVSISNVILSETDLCLLSEVPEIIKPNFYAYPNPVLTDLFVEGLPVNSNIDVFNLQGVMVISQKASEISIIDFSTLESGMYLIKCQFGIKKIVKL